MPANPYDHGPNPRAIARGLFTQAKQWFSGALTCSALAGCAGILAGLEPQTASYIAVAVLLLAFGIEYCTFRSDRLKDTANELQNKLDLADGLGLPIDASFIRDSFLDCSPKLRDTIRRVSVDERYFASREAPGPNRALANLEQATWWTARLVNEVARYTLLGMLVMFVVGVALFSLSLQALSDVGARQTVNGLIVAVLMLIPSLGLARLTAKYYEFSTRAQSIHEKARLLRDAGTMASQQVLDLWSEYQHARVCAPLIPNWIWARRRAYLNEMWEDARKREVAQ